MDQLEGIAQSAEIKNKAVFLDRDGTIIEEKNYLSNPEQIELIPGAAEAISSLNAAGFTVIVVTNQSGVARGMFGIEVVELINNKLRDMLLLKGAVIDAVYSCPHHIDGSVPQYTLDCACRKPKIGMAIQAARELNIDLTTSYMIGDKQCDVEFGLTFGAKCSYLVQTGNRQEWEHQSNCVVSVKSIVEAAQEILSDS